MHLIPAFALVLLTAVPSLAQAPVRAAVKSDGLVYLSGVVAAGPDVTMQTAAAIEKIAATLKAEGSTLANVANVSVVLKSATDMTGAQHGVREVLAEGSARPHDDHRRPAAHVSRRSRRAVGDRDSEWRRTDRGATHRLAHAAGSVQLRDQDRQHAVSGWARQPKWRRQHQRHG